MCDVLDTLLGAGHRLATKTGRNPYSYGVYSLVGQDRYKTSNQVEYKHDSPVVSWGGGVRDQLIGDFLTPISPIPG